MARIGFSLINRRVHLYLAMFLLPWVVMYGVSSVVFNHNELMREWFDHDGPQWDLLFEREYQRSVPAHEEDLRAFGAAVLRDVGMEGSFGVYRPNADEVVVYRFEFGSSQRLTYRPNEGVLKAEDRLMRPHHYLAEMHARGGFQQESLMADAWAAMVDLVCLAMVVWMASGFIMWWQLRRTRLWGAAALASGVAAFLVFLATL